MTVDTIFQRIDAFRKECKTILARVETSPERLMTVEASYQRLTGLSIKQDDLFRQALRCIEYGLYRAAYVMAWAAFVDFFHEKLAEDGFVKLRVARPNWKLNAVEDLREQSDFQVIEAATEIGFLRKTEKRALHGLLNSRNECGHPEDVHPDLNESLGYVTSLLKRVEMLKSRSL